MDISKSLLPLPALSVPDKACSIDEDEEIEPAQG